MNMRDTAWGIIPACAGSTHSNRFGDFSLGDHPRMCGEHLGGVPMWMMSGGSSPHVRGARHAWSEFRADGGIIPACAGSTTSDPQPAPRRWDHPRMCGEHRGWRVCR